MDDHLPPNLVQVGGPISRLSVSVRVASDVLDPDDITRLMQVQPKFAARKGDQRDRGGRTVTQRIGIWTFALSERPSPEWELDDAVNALLDRLPADLSIWHELGRVHRLDVFCGLFMGGDNQGADLRPQTLQRLAERGLTLDLDVYGPPPDAAAT